MVGVMVEVMMSMVIRLFSITFLLSALLSGFIAAHARNVAPVVSDCLALVHCQVVDGTGCLPIKDGAVLVEKGRISKVGETGSFPIPKGCTVLNLAGSTALPGFINAHVHQAYAPVNLQRWLSGGVTTVRDIGPFFSTQPRTIVKNRNRLNALNPEGARLISGTPLLTASGGYGGIGLSTPSEARACVSQFADEDIDIIKLAFEDDLQGRRWPIIDHDVAKAAVDEAHRRGLPVSAHACWTRNVKRALAVGVDDIAHMAVDVVPKQMIHAIVDAGIIWVPTLELWKIVSAMYQLDWLSVASENLHKFVMAGGQVALGTDYAGFSGDFDDAFPITEVKLMAEAGMSPLQIVTAGTRNAARVCGLGEVLGLLKPGFIADILVVSGDPTKRLEDFTNTLLVVKDGKVVFDNRRRP